MKRFPTAKRYRAAFQAIEKNLAPGYRAMLEAHYQAPNRTITLGELARAAGYKGEDGAKLQFGLLANVSVRRCRLSQPKSTVTVRQSGATHWRTFQTRRPPHAGTGSCDRRL